MEETANANQRQIAMMASFTTHGNMNARQYAKSLRRGTQKLRSATVLAMTNRNGTQKMKNVFHLTSPSPILKSNVERMRSGTQPFAGVSKRAEATSGARSQRN